MCHLRRAAITGLAVGGIALAVSLGSGSSVYGPVALYWFDGPTFLAMLFIPSALVVALLLPWPRIRSWITIVAVAVPCTYWLAFVPGMVLSRFELRTQRDAVANAANAFVLRVGRAPKDATELYPTGGYPEWTTNAMYGGVGVFDPWTLNRWRFDETTKAVGLEPTYQSRRSSDYLRFFWSGHRNEVILSLLALLTGLLVLVFGSTVPRSATRLGEAGGQRDNRGD
jgi:hypothetical protein